MTRVFFKNIVVVSLLAHALFLSLFSFSFARIIPKVDYAPLFFWGEVLPRIGLKIFRNNLQNKPSIFINRIDTSMMTKVDIASKPLFDTQVYYLKPAFLPVIKTEKSTLKISAAPLIYPAKRKEAVITFHPLLPYQLQLYFKDRQAVHIELIFNIVSVSGKAKKNILIKRKISSGNLDADLLSARYIGHYLFIQQAGFKPDYWQTVKIDLSP